MSVEAAQGACQCFRWQSQARVHVCAGSARRVSTCSVPAPDACQCRRWQREARVNVCGGSARLVSMYAVATQGACQCMRWRHQARVNVCGGDARRVSMYAVAARGACQCFRWQRPARVNVCGGSAERVSMFSVVAPGTPGGRGGGWGGAALTGRAAHAAWPGLRHTASRGPTLTHMAWSGPHPPGRLLLRARSPATSCSRKLYGTGRRGEQDGLAARTWHIG